MKIKKYIQIALIGALIMGSVSCNKDELDSNSIFDTTGETLDPNSASYQLDKWLQDNYLTPYNLDFRYKMQDVGTDMDYNLVPATYAKSVDLAVLTKYLWFDVYDKIVSPEFLKAYGPRIIHLIGSPAFNPANGTMILGLAEGGLKVSLFRVNSLDETDFNMLNEYYFKTMHHEFAHILHQTKTYPREFNLISTAYYAPNDWQERDPRVVASMGFTSPYASSEAREDFAETIANYITLTDAQWTQLLDWATKDWNNTPDGVDGKEIILQKVAIARQWFSEAWDINLDELRKEVQYRQNNFKIDELRDEVYKIK